MIRTAQQLGVAWRLLYLGRSRSTMAFLDELRSFTGSGIVEIHPSDERGRADLAAWIGSAPDESKLYVCGPAPVVGAVDGLTATWRHGWVRRERFAAPLQPAPARSEPFHVELRHSGTIVQVPTDVSVADALRRAGAPLLTSCGQGVCGTCETTVIEGTPDHRDSLLDDAERESNACFFPCVSRSISDRLVLDL
jgi:ferredoxin